MLVSKKLALASSFVLSAASLTVIWMVLVLPTGALEETEETEVEATLLTGTLEAGMLLEDTALLDAGAMETAEEAGGVDVGCGKEEMAETLLAGAVDAALEAGREGAALTAEPLAILAEAAGASDEALAAGGVEEAVEETTEGAWLTAEVGEVAKAENSVSDQIDSIKPAIPTQAAFCSL